MLNNLRAELVRKGYHAPARAVADVLKCTEKTARSKLDGLTPITVPEAVEIMKAYFVNDNFTIEYLFSPTSANQ